MNGDELAAILEAGANGMEQVPDELLGNAMGIAGCLRDLADQARGHDEITGINLGLQYPDDRRERE